MRVVIQRVKRASVAVEQEGVDEATTAPQDVVSEIGKGIVCLVGVNEADEADDALWICKQITSAKLFEGMSEANADKRWRSSVKQNGFEILLVSQVRFNTGLRFHRRCCQARGRLSRCLQYACILRRPCGGCSSTQPGNLLHTK